MKGTNGIEATELLRKIQLDRDRFAQELDEIRRHPPGEEGEVVKRGEGLKGVLETAGLELEKTLAAMFEQDKH